MEDTPHFSNQTNGLSAVDVHAERLRFLWDAKQYEAATTPQERAAIGRLRAIMDQQAMARLFG